MAVVVDASAIGAVMFGEPAGGEIAGYLRDETLLAPALIDFELTNLALKKLRRQPTDAEAIARRLEAALRLPLSRVAVPGGAVFALAALTGLTAYDASYLWLAMSRNAEFVTLDEELHRAWQQLQT